MATSLLRVSGSTSHILLIFAVFEEVYGMQMVLVAVTAVEGLIVPECAEYRYRIALAVMFGSRNLIEAFP